MPENTFGVTLTDSKGREYQTWVTTYKDGGQLINAIREEYDNS